MMLQIRKKAQEEWLIQYIFTLPFLFFFLMDICHIPALLKYTIDIAWIMLLMVMVVSKIEFPNPQSKKLVRIAFVFFLTSVIGYVLEYQSVLYYLWGFRNNVRFFVFFAACTLYLKKEGADSFFQILDKLFCVNLLVTLYQFVFLDLKQDHLGGIFGIEKGCNGYTNIFLVIITAWHIIQYMNKKEKREKMFVICLLSLMIAAMAELKAFFLEFMVVVLLAVAITKFSTRKLWIILISILVVVVGLRVFELIFPYFNQWLKWEKIWNSLTQEQGYTNSNDLNRLTAIPIVWNRFLDSSLRKWFGLGLGNCDHASGYSFLTSSFYRRYNELNYTWFSSAFLLLEMGISGLVLQVWFFVQVYLQARQREKIQQADPRYCQLARIMAIVCLILLIYNSSLRTESAYMVYFVLALPFIKQTPPSTSSEQNPVPITSSLEGGHPQ